MKKTLLITSIILVVLLLTSCFGSPCAEKQYDIKLTIDNLDTQYKDFEGSYYMSVDKNVQGEYVAYKLFKDAACTTQAEISTKKLHAVFIYDDGDYSCLLNEFSSFKIELTDKVVSDTSVADVLVLKNGTLVYDDIYDGAYVEFEVVREVEIAAEIPR